MAQSPYSGYSYILYYGNGANGRCSMLLFLSFLMLVFMPCSSVCTLTWSFLLYLHGRVIRRRGGGGRGDGGGGRGGDGIGVKGGDKEAAHRMRRRGQGRRRHRGAATEGRMCKCIYFSFILFYLILFLIWMLIQFWCSGGGGDSVKEAAIEEANSRKGGGLGTAATEGGTCKCIYSLFI